MPELEKLIKVHIRLLGYLEPHSINGRLMLEVSAGCTLERIMHKMVNQLGEDFRLALLDYQGKVNGGIEIFLNGEHISPYQLSKRFLQHDSELIFMPMIAGG